MARLPGDSNLERQFCPRSILLAHRSFSEELGRLALIRTGNRGFGDLCDTVSPRAYKKSLLELRDPAHLLLILLNQKDGAGRDPHATISLQP